MLNESTEGGRGDDEAPSTSPRPPKRHQDLAKLLHETTRGTNGTLRRSIIVPGGLITSTGVVFVVLVLVFVVLGVV